MRKLLISTLCTATLLTAACSDTGKIPGVYRPDIQQGNVVTQEMVDKLRPDMTKAQVRYIMGTPLLVDTFHQDRWDYLYTLEADGNPRTEEHISIYFKDDHLVRIEGDYRPSPNADPLENGQESVYTVPDYDQQNEGFFGRTMDKMGLGSDDKKSVTPEAKPQDSTKPADQQPDTAEPAPQEPEAKPESEKQPEEKGFFGRMWDKVGFGSDDEEETAAAAASAPAAPAASEPTGATTAPLRDPAVEPESAESPAVEAAPESEATPATESPAPETAVGEEPAPAASEGAPVEELSEGTKAQEPKEEKGFFGRMWNKIGFGSDEE